MAIKSVNNAAKEGQFERQNTAEIVDILFNFPFSSSEHFTAGQIASLFKVLGFTNWVDVESSLRWDRTLTGT